VTGFHFEFFFFAEYASILDIDAPSRADFG
jgi:hypothetical protein